MVARRIRVKVKGTWHTVEVPESGGYPIQLVVDGQPLEVEVELEGPTSVRQDTPSAPARSTGPIGLQGITESGSRLVRSPMPGRIISVSVKVWDKLTPGMEVCILETMKMEQSVQVSTEGSIRAVFIEPGDSVNAGDPLIQLE